MKHHSILSFLTRDSYRNMRIVLFAFAISLSPITSWGQGIKMNPSFNQGASARSVAPPSGQHFPGPGLKTNERSVNMGSQPLRVVFSNQTNENVVAHWIDLNGLAREIGTMVPLQTVELTTFPGHVTTFSSGSRLLATFRASTISASAYAIVGSGGPPVNPSPSPAQAVISSNDFNGQKHVTREVIVSRGDQLTVDLRSNASTGFRWGEQTTNNNPSVVRQVKYESKGPVQRSGGSPPPPGAPGTEVWIFEALKPGVATLSFSYSQAWQGGTKGAETLKVVVRVR